MSVCVCVFSVYFCIYKCMAYKLKTYNKRENKNNINSIANITTNLPPRHNYNDQDHITELQGTTEPKKKKKTKLEMKIKLEMFKQQNNYSMF